MPKVKAVFFDLDDTLVLTSDFDKVAFAAVCDLAKAKYNVIDKEVLLAAFKKRFKATPWDVEYKVEVTQWRARMWHEALQEQKVEDEALAAAMQTCFDETRLGDFPFVSGTQEMVEELEAKGIQTVIITNGHHHVQKEKLKACAANKIFKNIIIGGDEVLAGRKEKPAPEIFQKACDMVGVAPNEAVHVGDSLSTDVQGGINAGLLATVFVSKTLAPAPTGGPQPTFTVALVTETIGCIEKLEAQ
mmetsp:Transcript_37249/g.71422  ORF Transcript_37249/g.71422 Transcript_37249/m.71422 type:complete len:245 (-) Transcript_37249:231-965(-)